MDIFAIDIIMCKGKLASKWPFPTKVVDYLVSDANEDVTNSNYYYLIILILFYCILFQLLSIYMSLK